jgi:hypothetical protein
LRSVEEEALDEFTDPMRLPNDHITTGEFDKLPEAPEPPVDDSYDGWLDRGDQYDGQ